MQANWCPVRKLTSSHGWAAGSPVRASIGSSLATGLACLAAISAVTPLSAAEHSVSLQAGGYYTSNVNQSSTPVAGSVGVVKFTGMYKDKTPRLDIDLAGVMEGKFLSGADDYLLPSGEATVNAVLLKNRLDWYLRDRMEVVRVDALLEDVPSNQESANVFVTGPTLMMRLGPRDQLVGELRVENDWYQKSASKKADKTGTALRYLHDISPVKKLSADVEEKRVKAANNYVKYDGFMTYKQTGPQSTLDMKVGATKIEPEAASKIEENTHRLIYTYRSNTRNVWAITTEKELIDAGDALVSTVLPADPLARDSGLFVNNSTAISYNYAYAEKLFSANLFHRKRRYLQTNINETANGVNFNYYLRTGRASSWRFSGIYAQTTYSDFATTDTDYQVSAEYGFDINKEVSWHTGYTYRTRKSILPSRSFDESIILGYIELKRGTLQP